MAQYFEKFDNEGPVNELKCSAHGQEDTVYSVVYSQNMAHHYHVKASSPLVWLVEGVERWEVLTTPGVLPQDWGGNEPNRTVTCMGLKATVNDRRHLALCYDEFRGPQPGLCRSAGHASSHPRVPRAPQAGVSRRSLAGVGLSESVRCHGPGLALLTNGGFQQQ
ncbi:zinc finger protein [Trichonephila clavipes]|nr:zinc finger protein [Trichonephila clavipes]